MSVKIIKRFFRCNYSDVFGGIDCSNCLSNFAFILKQCYCPGSSKTILRKFDIIHCQPIQCLAKFFRYFNAADSPTSKWVAMSRKRTLPAKRHKAIATRLGGRWHRERCLSWISLGLRDSLVTRRYPCVYEKALSNKLTIVLKNELEPLKSWSGKCPILPF